MSERTENLKLIISGDGRLLGTELDKTARYVQTSSRKMSMSLGQIGIDMSRRLGSNLKQMIWNPLTGIGAAVALYAGKQIVDFDSKVTRLALQARLSAADQMKLRKEIVETGLASGQSREAMADGIDAIVQRTGDLQFARDVMRDMGIASTATGASMNDMGALASNLQQKLGLSAEQIKVAFNVLSVQGKVGAFTLQDMATQGERLFAAAGRFGTQGMGGLRTFGAMIQLARMGTGSSEQATTSLEGIMTDIIDKQKEIRKQAGVSIFKNDTTKELKTLDVIMKDIITGTKGDITKLNDLFGRQSIRGVSAMVQMYKETGGFKFFDELVNSDAGRANELMEDFARYSQSSAFQISRLTGTITDMADVAISPVLSTLNEQVKALLSDPEALAQFKQDIADVALSLEAMAGFAGKVIRLLQIGKGLRAQKESDTTFKNWYQVPEAERYAQQKKWRKAGLSGQEQFEAMGRMGREYVEEFGPRRNYVEQLDSKPSRKDIWDSATAPVDVKNNIVINIDKEGNAWSVVSDNPNAKTSVQSNRGLIEANN